MTKDEIRKKIKDERDQLSHEEWMKLSQKVCSKLLDHPWLGQAQRIALYSAKISELSLSFAQSELFHSGKELAFPRVTEDGLKFYQVDEETSFEKSKFGILEPVSDKILEGIQVYIVPAVAFDRQGHRLGYGKGYYDRALEKTYAKKIGVAFDFQIFEALPYEKHDIRMNTILTNSEEIEVL